MTLNGVVAIVATITSMLMNEASFMTSVQV